jgi:ferredoxin
MERDRLAAFLDQIATRYHLVAPVAEDGVVDYRRVDDARRVVLDELSTVPPKTHFFPQTEELYSYSTVTGLEIKETVGTPAAVLFGVRPCDLKGFLALDPVFAGRFRDPYYWSKRERTIIIGLSCTTVQSTCFCQAFDGSPVNGEGADVLFTPLEAVYLVEILTSKGEQLAAEFSTFLGTEGVEEALRGKEALARELDGRFIRQVDLEGVKEKADRMFDHPYWRRLARRCLGCGICTFLCPTCHCFDVVDENRGDRTGLRVRCWDSCMFTDFTLHTSGHNPRPSKTERLRNRILHKLKYHLDRYGLHGCVGCGRCVAKCPVNIDLTKVIAEIREVD